jgi:spermidine/putrescine ABC transporter ATP-binding subunit
MASADLAVEEIGKSYGLSGVPAVNNVSLMIERGQFLTLLGPSGCGKTTLLRIIAGFIAPSYGRVRVRGQDVTQLPPQKRPTAMVFQNYALFPHMTAADNVAFGLKVRRLPKAEIDERVRKALTAVDLAQVGERFPSQLSGGQQQRIALARALAIEPPVLLMDEPLGALDAKLREEMQYELSAIQRRLSITTLYVTHDQEEAFSMSDHVAVMNQGRILQLDAPDEIYQRPKSLFVANFVGRSNAVRGIVQSGTQTIRDPAGNVFTAPIPPELAPGSSAILIVRPEDITLNDSPGADNRIEGTVERERFTGGARLYYVRINPKLMIIASDRSGNRSKPSERVRLHWRSERSIVLPGEESPPEERREAPDTRSR